MKQDTPTNSAERVKAFRERLDSQFKRVETYVTEDEKTRIQAIRTQESVTMDIAVAGLVRLGLEKYEELRAQESSVLASANVRPTLTGAVAGPLDAPLFNASASAGILCTTATCLSMAEAPGTSTAESFVTTSEPLDSPVARFFKKRKEIINE